MTGRIVELRGYDDVELGIWGFIEPVAGSPRRYFCQADVLGPLCVHDLEVGDLVTFEPYTFGLGQYTTPNARAVRLLAKDGDIEHEELSENP